MSFSDIRVFSDVIRRSRRQTAMAFWLFQCCLATLPMLLKATVVQSNLKQDFGDLKCCHTPVLQPQSSGWTEALGGTLKTAVDTPVINMAFLIGAQKSGILQPNIRCVHNACWNRPHYQLFRTVFYSQDHGWNPVHHLQARRICSMSSLQAIQGSSHRCSM